MFVYIHILAAICWLGYTLFWFMLVPPLRKKFDEKTGTDLLLKTTEAKWPPIALPDFFRVKCINSGWYFLGCLIVSGFVLLYLRGFNMEEITTGKLFRDRLGLLGIAKVGLVAIMMYIQFFIRKRSINQARLVFWGSLLVISISILLVR